MYKIISIISVLSVALFLGGCQTTSSRDPSFERAAEAHLAVLDKEKKMSKTARQHSYEKELWFNEKLWIKKGVNNEQRVKDYGECLLGSSQTEHQISQKLEGTHPMQLIHLRASIEVCMITKHYTPAEGTKALLCDQANADILPICSVYKKVK